MTSSADSLPSWLNRALSNRKYKKYLFTVLNDRECTREIDWVISQECAGDSSKVPESHLKQYRVDVGKLKENAKENRYYAIMPFDRTRVVVGLNSHPEGRYLNANWVRELYGGKWWIATQAPLPNTAHTFLSLLMQEETRPPTHIASADSLAPGPCRIRTAVQLTVAAEGGWTKAHPYFPSTVGESYTIPAPVGCADPALKISLEAERKVEAAGCVLSTVRLVRCSQPVGEKDALRYNKVKEIGEPTFFTHLLFTHWPDFGVPEGPTEKAALMAFARLVDEINTSTPPFLPPGTPFHPNPPIAVNCSAGVGRTGTFIALSSLLRAHGLLSPGSSKASIAPLPPLTPSPQGPLSDRLADDEVAQEVDSLREQRPRMVQETDQQMLVYELLAVEYHELKKAKVKEKAKEKEKEKEKAKKKAKEKEKEKKKAKAKEKEKEKAKDKAKDI